MTDSASRAANRMWLTTGIDRNGPESWESIYVDSFGMEGALDLLAAEAGDFTEINLTHRPFSSNAELKFAIYDAREAANVASRLAYNAAFAEIDRVRQERAATILGTTVPEQLEA